MTGPYTVTDLEIAEALRPWFEDDAVDAAREVRHLMAPLIRQAQARAWVEGYLYGEQDYQPVDPEMANPYENVKRRAGTTSDPRAAQQGAAQVELFRAQILDPEREEAFTPLAALLSSFEGAVRAQVGGAST